MRLNYKLWVEDNEGNRVMGEGLEMLLLGVDRGGSISRAASDASISYRNAWDKIKKAEQRLGFDLIRKYSGGLGGGGSHLTPRGKMLLAAFQTFYADAEGFLHASFSNCFAEVMQETRSTQVKEDGDEDSQRTL